MRTPAGWQAFIEQHALPAKAALDALHIAVAVVMGMDYVLTWNCTHIADAVIRPKIGCLPAAGVRSAGYLHARRADGVTMARDEIVDETRRVRDEFAKSHDYDVKKIVRALKRAEASSGRKLVRLSPRRSGRRPAKRKTG
jgi:hypothetical protein